MGAEIISIKNKNKLINICKELKIKRLFLFGSVLTKGFNKSSDIDFLVSFNEDISIEEYTENYFTLHYKLRELFKRDIDILTERTLSNPFLIENINNSKMLIYEA